LILDKLRTGKEILHGWLGIGVQDINHAMADYFKLKKPEGVLVLQVVKNGPADKGGLEPEDIITQFDGKKVTNTLGFLKLIKRARVGQEVRIKIMRRGLPRTLKVTLEKRPHPGRITRQKDYDERNEGQPGGKRPVPQKRPPVTKPLPRKGTAQPKKQVRVWRGISVAEITEEFAQSFDIGSTQGIIVTGIEPGSQAEAAAIRVKDIITQMNTTPIKTLADYEYVAATVSGNVLVKTQRGYFMVLE